MKQNLTSQLNDFTIKGGLKKYWQNASNSTKAGLQISAILIGGSVVVMIIGIILT